MLSKIIEKLPILPNNSLNCPNIAKKFPIMPNDVLYSSKVTKYYFSCLLSELCYGKEHSNVIYYCRINPYTVRYWPILSSGPLFRNIPIKANLQLLQVWFKCSKILAICNYESMQVCKYAGMQVWNEKYK